MIHYQWLGSIEYFFDYVVKISIVEERHDGTEYLFLHHQRVFVRVFDNGGGNEAGLASDIAAINNVSSVVVFEQFFNTADVEIIDDLAVIAFLLQVLSTTIKLLNFLK